MTALRTNPGTAGALDDQAARLRAMAGAGRRQAWPVEAPAVGGPRIVTITSGKGGVGKTSLAVNLAAALAARSVRTTLVDMDFGLANADVLCGLSPRARLDAALDPACQIEELAMAAPGGFRLIPGAVGMGRLPDLPEHQQVALLRNLRASVAGADVVLLDTGAGMGQLVRASALCADLTLVVVTPEPTSIADAYALIKTLCQSARRMGTNFAPPQLVVNQALSPQEAAEVAGRVSAVGARFLGVQLPLAGALMQDVAVPQGVRARCPFVLGAPASGASLAVGQLATHLAGVLQVAVRDANRLPPAIGFWDRLARLVGGRVG